MSSRELAELTNKGEGGKGVSASHINKIENGKAHPTFQTLQKIAAALGLPLVIVLEGSKANPDAVTVVSTPVVAQSFLQALARKELVQLVLACQGLTDQQLETVLGVAHSLHGSTQPTNEAQ